MKIIFLGTPEFALPSLNALIASRHEVLAVVTKEDKPSGRGNKIEFSPVKKCALEHNIPIFQFKKIRTEGVEILQSLKPDIMVTAAYGQILSQDILNIAKYGVINVHGSLLPKYRGAAPVQWAIIRGEQTIGITIMQTFKGIDCGDIIFQKELQLAGNETAAEALEQLSRIGADALLQTLDAIEQGKAVWTKQDEAQATHFPMLRKTDGELDFSKSAKSVVNQIRGVNPWPVAYTFLDNIPIKIWSACQIEGDYDHAQNGEVVLSDVKQGLIVKCGKGQIKILELQFPNSKRLKTEEFLKGKKICVGTIFSSQL